MYGTSSYFNFAVLFSNGSKTQRPEIQINPRFLKGEFDFNFYSTSILCYKFCNICFISWDSVIMVKYLFRRKRRSYILKFLPSLKWSSNYLAGELALVLFWSRNYAGFSMQIAWSPYVYHLHLIMRDQSFLGCSYLIYYVTSIGIRLIDFLQRLLLY